MVPALSDTVRSSQSSHSRSVRDGTHEQLAEPLGRVKELERVAQVHLDVQLAVEVLAVDDLDLLVDQLLLAPEQQQLLPEAASR